MTQDELNQYVRRMADALGLRWWTFTISGTPCHDDAGAQINVMSGKFVGILQFHRNFLDWGAERIREDVTHELLHAWMQRMEDTLEYLKPHVAPAVWDVAWQAHRQQEELAAHGLSMVLAPGLPLPGKPFLEALSPEPTRPGAEDGEA